MSVSPDPSARIAAALLSRPSAPRPGPLLLAFGALLSACAGDDAARAKGDTAADEGGVDGYGGGDGSADGSADGGSGGYGGGYTGDDSAGEASGGVGEGDTDDPADTAAPEDTAAPAECDGETPVVLYLSPDDSNSVASPALVRAALLEAGGPSSDAPIRVWEFMNAYSYPYPEAAAGALELHVALAPDSAGAADTYQLQIGVQAGDLVSRSPLHLVFAVDTSGSMAGQGITTAQSIGRAVAGQLEAGDKVSVLAWSDRRAVLLDGYTVGGPDDGSVLSAFSALGSAGTTDLSRGLRTAYEIASAHAAPGWLSRVVLISDGGANVGTTDASIIGGAAGEGDADGVYLAGLGVGSVRSYDQALMDVVTDLGGGASLYLSGEAEVERQLGGALLRTFGVAARDVRVQLDLPPGFEVVRFSGEELSADPTEIEPQHLAPDDTMVFLQTIRTCAPELLGPEAELTVHLRWLDAETLAEQSLSLPLRFADAPLADPAPLLKGQAVFTTADALRAVQSGEADRAERLTAAAGALLQAMSADPSDPELDELAGMLAAYGGPSVGTP